MQQFKTLFIFLMNGIAVTADDDAYSKLYKVTAGDQEYLCRPGATSRIWQYVHETDSHSAETCAADCNAKTGCVAFDFTVKQFRKTCRMVNSIENRQSPRTWTGPTGHDRQYCKRKYTCADHTCNDNQLKKLDSFICGVKPCTPEQCCVDKQQYCDKRLKLEHKCVDYDGICIRESFAKKSNFDEITCGTGTDGICTTDICCDVYESLYQCRDGYFDSDSSILASGDYNSFHGCAAFCADTTNCYAFQFTNVYDGEVANPETCKLAAKDAYTPNNGANDDQFIWCESDKMDADGEAVTIERKTSGNRIYGCRPGSTSRRYWTSNNGKPGYIDITNHHSFEDCAAECNKHDDCIAIGWTDYFKGTDTKQCRLVASVTGEFAPRNEPGDHDREFCRLRYTCQDFSGSCDENQFEMPDSLECGTSPCTKEQCCLNPNEIEVCTSYIVEEHKCSDYEGICKWNETYSPKKDFDSIDCGNKPCTVEQCCDHYDDLYDCESGMTSKLWRYIEEGPWNSFLSCAAVCESNEKCVAFDYTNKDYTKSCRMVTIDPAQTPRLYQNNLNPDNWKYCARKRIRQLPEVDHPEKRTVGGTNFFCRPGMISRFGNTKGNYQTYFRSTGPEACAAKCNADSTCVAFDYTLAGPALDHDSPVTCRLTKSIEGHQSPRTWTGPHGLDYHFCKRNYTCADFGGECASNTLRKPDGFKCGVTPCTSEQCCLSEKKDCAMVKKEVHKCLDNEGICPSFSHVNKDDFTSIECGTGDDGQCTVDLCCDSYESLYKCEDGTIEIENGVVDVLASGDYNSFKGCAALCSRTSSCAGFDYTDVYDGSVAQPQTCRVVSEGHTPNYGSNSGQRKYCVPQDTDADAEAVEIVIKSSDDETKKYACRPGSTSRRYWTSNNGEPGYVDITNHHSFQDCAAECNKHDDCIALDWTDHFKGTDSNQCRLVASVTGEFTPRNDPAMHDREFCQLQYTCEQFTGSCDENQFKKNGFVCGTSACTKEQCCVDKTDVEVCDFNVNMCSANEGICKWTETHRRKDSFDEVKCDGPCTVEQCCDPYEELYDCEPGLTSTDYRYIEHGPWNSFLSCAAVCERHENCAAFAWTPNDLADYSCRVVVAGQTPRLGENDYKFEYCTRKVTEKLGGSGSKGSGGGSSGSKSYSLDLSSLFGGSKSQSTFGEWARTSDKQECRSECRPKSADKVPAWVKVGDKVECDGYYGDEAYLVSSRGKVPTLEACKKSCEAAKDCKSITYFKTKWCTHWSTSCAKTKFNKKVTVSMTLE